MPSSITPQPGIRFEAGHLLRLLHADLSGTVSVGAWVRAVYDDGTTGMMTVAPAATGTPYAFRSAVGSETTPQGGYVVGGAVYSAGGTTTGTLQRGGCAVALFIGNTAQSTALISSGMVPLCQGYIWSAQPYVPIGMFEVLGPAGGRGAFLMVSVASDAAGNAAEASADVQIVSTGSQIRRWYGFVIYYNCAAVVASRTIAPQVRLPGIIAGGTPTGFAGDGKVWTAATLTLTTGEEGIYFANSSESGTFVSRNDNGTLSYDNSTTAPFPLPYFISQNGTDGIAFNPNIGAGDAGDRWTCNLLVEEWMVF